MKMNVEHGLSGVFAVINDHPVSVSVEMILRGNGFGDKEQMADKLPVRRDDRMNVGDMFFGHNENMGGRLGIEVLKRDRKRVFMDDFCGNLFCDDLAKNAV